MLLQAAQCALAISFVLTGICSAADEAAPLQVDVATLDGKQIQGELLRVDASTLTLDTPGGQAQLALADLLDVQFPAAPPARLPDSSPMHILLVDGSRLHASQVKVDGKLARCETSLFGPVDLPAGLLSAIRFSSHESRFDDAWRKLLKREPTADMVILQKESVLDHLDGVVGQIDDQHVNVLYENEPLSIPREKVFGVIYYRRTTATGESVCRVELDDSQVAGARQVSWDGRGFRLTLLSGAEVDVGVEAIRRLDFSLNKLAYLSDMEPRDVKYTPFFDVVWKYRRDRNLDGGPIRLGGKTYARGLALHSRTVLRYRIGGEYRRFHAVLGIDQVVSPKGDVHVVIKGDTKTLFEADIAGVDRPRIVDLDVSGVRDLEILVDFGADLDIADHLDLADAKVIK